MQSCKRFKGARMKKIFKQLARIFVELNEESRNTQPEFFTPGLNLSTASLKQATEMNNRQTTPSKFTATEVFIIGVADVRQAIVDILKGYAEDLVSAAAQRVKEVMTVILEERLEDVQHKVQQIRDFVMDLERLRDYTPKMRELLAHLHHCTEILKGDLFEIPVEA